MEKKSLSPGGLVEISLLKEALLFVYNLFG